MKELLVWILTFCLLMWGAVELGSRMAKADKQDQEEKELCIVLKHQKEAEKFLDMDCQRYVRYKQDNE
mgnify:CR=1 FL=1